jgi:homoserine kinase type II
MAVFTAVSETEASDLLAQLGLGRLVAFKGILAGIENSNFFVDTDQGRFVLTVFERLTHSQLPFYLDLMQHLAGKGLPVPAPQADAQGRTLFTLQGKPAAVVSWLEGEHQLAPDVFHCEQLGQTLARLHVAVTDFPGQLPNLRGLGWWRQVSQELLPHLDEATTALLCDELQFQETLAASNSYRDLPRGAVHADLFRDNAMFKGLPGREQISGVFDFYFAGVDTFLFDLAVCLNDWCIDLPTGRLVEERAQALVKAYEQERPLSGTEHRLLPALLRAAALRFWLSRLHDWHLPRSASLLKPHDPKHFERVLRQRRETAFHAA